MFNYGARLAFVAPLILLAAQAYAQSYGSYPSYPSYPQSPPATSSPSYPSYPQYPSSPSYPSYPPMNPRIDQANGSIPPTSKSIKLSTLNYVFKDSVVQALPMKSIYSYYLDSYGHFTLVITFNKADSSSMTSAQVYDNSGKQWPKTLTKGVPYQAESLTCSSSTGTCKLALKIPYAYVKTPYSVFYIQAIYKNGQSRAMNFLISP